MKKWKKLSQEEIKQRVFAALSENVDYYNQNKTVAKVVTKDRSLESGNFH